MIAPYENQLIGAFLFALGYEGGRLKAGPMPANLFQQTPLDRTFSDLVVGADTCLVLEFKRSASEVSSELGKWSQEAFDQFVRDEDLQHTSRRAHLVIYGREGCDQIDLRGCLYLDVLGIGDAKVDRFPAQVLIALLYGSLTSPKRRLGVSPARLMLYLNRLARLKTINTGGRIGKESTWLAVVRKDDRFLYLAAESLKQLLELRRDHEPAPALDKDIEGPEFTM